MLIGQQADLISATSAVVGKLEGSALFIPWLVSIVLFCAPSLSDWYVFKMSL